MKPTKITFPRNRLIPKIPKPLALILACTLILHTACDCGFIKLLNKIKEYDGENADIIKGKFNGYMSAQFSVFGFMRILGTELKTYTLFKFDNEVALPARALQETPSGYNELMTISFSKYNNSGEEVNLLLSKFL